ncbi:glycosyltransferase [Weissella sp. MSCH1]|uniref:glycosyltransferase n=1 Tax=Weissella sp. MSCH1 TaxID=3383343 RepID=UPI003896B1B0
MIFVTVGTHEQPFNRLIKEIERLLENEEIKQEVIIQSGYSNFRTTYCVERHFMDYHEMNRLMTEADVVITHGGPATFLNAFRLGKQPVIVPRKVEFGEHVNNHQSDFITRLSKVRSDLIVVDDISDLIDGIREVDNGKTGENSNNSVFISKFSKMFEGIV